MFADVPAEFATMDMQKSLSDKNVEKALITAAKGSYKKSVEAGTTFGVKRLGNLYTASLYGGLSSLLTAVEPETLVRSSSRSRFPSVPSDVASLPSSQVGKRVGLYAYGSGAAASFFALKVVSSPAVLAEKLNLKERLDSMKIVPCEEFVKSLKIREETHNAVSYTPVGSVDDLWPGAYYLAEIDSMYRRTYARRE
jgi:hydroxymethylglutaryl-CoA synthase